MPRFEQSTWHRFPTAPARKDIELLKLNARTPTRRSASLSDSPRPFTAPRAKTPVQLVSSTVNVSGSSPLGQCRSEQSGPKYSGSCVSLLPSPTGQEESQTQPKIARFKHEKSKSDKKSMFRWLLYALELHWLGMLGFGNNSCCCAPTASHDAGDRSTPPAVA